jgi:hypothetical protein
MYDNRAMNRKLSCAVVALVAVIGLGEFAPAAPVEAEKWDGQPKTFGRMIYRVPRGWHEKRYSTGVIIAPDQVPKGEHLDVTLMTSKELAGDLPEALAASWDDACTQMGTTQTRTVDGTPYMAQAVRKSFRGWEYIRADGTVRATADGRDYLMNLTVIKVNDRYERILVLSKQNRHQFHDYSLYSFPAHHQAIQEFIFGMNFDDWTAAEVQPASLKGNGIVGVWNGISMFGGKLKASYAIFFANGQVFFGSRMPIHGCDEFNTWVDAEMVSRYWGTYAFEDGRGAMKMGYGEVPLQQDGDILILTTSRTPHRFVRLASVDGVKFDGRYAFGEHNGKVPSIVFTADGRFEDDGALDILNPNISYPFKTTAEPGGGTYAVKDFSVTFDYKDGRKLQLAFSGAEYDKQNPSPDTLSMGYADQVLRKR